MFYSFVFYNCIHAQIGNYVSNGSFELKYNCDPPYTLDKAIGWANIGSDTTVLSGKLYAINCFFNAPYTDGGFQLPYSGQTFFRMTLYCTSPCTYYYSRSYPRNRLRAKLEANKTYCVKMHVNLENESPYASSNFGFYFGDNTCDTINYANGPITYLSPQIKNPIGNIVTDTINWVPITGTFVATGKEKYLVLGNFESNANTTKSLVIPGYPYTWSEYFIDNVSCIELNLPAYAGPDKSVIQGDSAFIGREPDFATDAGCIWYKLPNMATPLNTISGLWVKPTVTTTYVVKQILECSPEKWDTVVIYMNPLGIERSSAVENDLKIYPVPANDYLELRVKNVTVFKEFNSVSIYNHLGQIIREEEIKFENKTLKIKTEDLQNGVYLLQLKHSSAPESSSGQVSLRVTETVSKRFVVAR